MELKPLTLNDALPVFAALSQETRLRAFRLLVQAGPEGLAAGTLSETLNTPNNTLSFHLGHLTRAGLVEASRVGRSIIYRASYPAMQALIAFLVHDCCSRDCASFREDSAGCTVIELGDLCPTATPAKPATE